MFSVVQQIEDKASREVGHVNYFTGNSHAEALSALVMASATTETDHYSVRSVTIFIDPNVTISE